MSDALSPEADLAKVYGESTKCPVCGAFAKTLPHPEHRWVCAVCGAPRVVMPDNAAIPEEAAVALREAASAQRQSAMQRFLSFAMGIPAGLALLLAIALAPASFIAAGVIIATGVVLAFLASRASRKGATERKRLRSAVERAYEAAISELAGENLTNAQIAAGLRIAEADVEAARAVQGQIRVAVPARIAATMTESASETETESDTETAAEAEKKA
jgi:ribosomal protein S27AE